MINERPSWEYETKRGLTQWYGHVDFYEGHPNFFQRRKVWTEVEHKRVWMYILTVDGLNDPKQATSVDDGMWEAGEDEATFWNQDLTL